MHFDRSNLFWIFLFAVVLIFIGGSYSSDTLTLKPSESISITPNVLEAKNGLVKSYRTDGSLHTGITYSNGMKNGPATLYYENGRPMLEMNYANGLRTGYAKKYYEDGELYATTPFSNDSINGIRSTFFRNGILKAEIPYFNSQPGIGLKEYYKSGEQKMLPKLSISHLLEGEQFMISMRIEECKRATYYWGALYKNRYLIEDPAYVSILPEKAGSGYLQVPNTTKSISLICKCITTAGYPYVQLVEYVLH